MAEPASPWDSDPIVAGQPPSDPGAAPWTNDPAVPQPVSAAAPAAPPEGFTEPQKQAILGYIPKAKDAADLQAYAVQLSGNKHGIGNAQDVLDSYRKGVRNFAWEPPVAVQAPPAQQGGTLDDLRNAVGDGIFTGLDAMMPGLGTFLRAHRDAGRAYTANAADAAAGDYGPEIAGFLDTATDPSAYGDFGASLDRNVAHEHALLTGESDGHPIASAAGQLTGAALTAPLAGEALDAAGIAASGSRLASAGRAATGGAIYGSGAAGPDDRLAGAATGAALGAGTDLALPYVPTVAKRILQVVRPAGEAASPESLAAAQAASDLGITLPKFALSDADRAKAAALEQKPFGAPVRQAASEMVDTSKAARDQIATDIGTPAATAQQLGDQTLDAAVAANKGRRASLGGMYDQARDATAGVTIPPTHTVAAIDNILADEGQRLAGSKAAPILAGVKQRIEEAGQITVQQARDLRTDLRDQLTNEAGATPTNADRLTNMVMSGVNADMDSGLTAAGRGDALNLYKQADAGWAQQRDLEDNVLKPFLGKDFDNWGEDVAKKINSDVKGNGTRVARFLSTLPDDQANNVRATIISHLGSASDGTQNAAGDAFSLNTFLTNWNQIKGARNLIFPKDTRDALTKLADVAQVAKASEGLRNKSNTGRVMSSLALGSLAELGGGASLATGDLKPLAFGMLSSSLMAARQYGAAKLLANPNFAKKLAATPMNPKAAAAFWSRPWVKQMQIENPAIAGEISVFQNAFLNHANDNLARTPVSAEPEQDQRNQ